MARQDFSNIKLTRGEDVFGVPDTPLVTADNIVRIPLSELHTFSKHMFQVRDDDKMTELADSIREGGVRVAGIVRTHPEGGYEILSGHRRRRAAELAGLTEMPVVIYECDDDEAMLTVVDTNFQREEKLPSEKAWSYRERNEAMNRRGKRTDLTFVQVEQKFDGAPIAVDSRKELSELTGESPSQIQRYIRLTYLIEPLIKMVDGEDENKDTLSFTVGVTLSYLTENEQWLLCEVMQGGRAKPSVNQSKEMRKLSASGELTKAAMVEILDETAEKDAKLVFKPKCIAQ